MYPLIKHLITGVIVTTAEMFSSKIWEISRDKLASRKNCFSSKYDTVTLLSDLLLKQMHKREYMTKTWGGSALHSMHHLRLKHHMVMSCRHHMVMVTPSRRHMVMLTPSMCHMVTYAYLWSRLWCIRPSCLPGGQWLVDCCEASQMRGQHRSSLLLWLAVNTDTISQFSNNECV